MPLQDCVFLPKKLGQISQPLKNRDVQTNTFGLEMQLLFLFIMNLSSKRYTNVQIAFLCKRVIVLRCVVLSCFIQFVHLEKHNFGVNLR